MPPGELANYVSGLMKKQTFQRISGVPFDVYKGVFKSAPFQYISFVILTMSTTAIKVFTDWWIGQVKSNTSLSDIEKMLLYSGLVVSFGCSFGLAAIVTLWTSNLVTKSITFKTCESLAYTKLDWFLEQRPLKVANKIGKDYE